MPAHFTLHKDNKIAAMPLTNNEIYMHHNEGKPHKYAIQMTMFVQVPNQPNYIHRNHHRRSTFAANNDACIEEGKEC
jgi:hypothetical protein